jgi:hypothetical protein
MYNTVFMGCQPGLVKVMQRAEMPVSSPCDEEEIIDDIT